MRSTKDTQHLNAVPERKVNYRLAQQVVDLTRSYNTASGLCYLLLHLNLENNLTGTLTIL